MRPPGAQSLAMKFSDSFLDEIRARLPVSQVVSRRVPLKRAGKPDEIAQAITYLASDKASFVTGQVLGVNGGKTAS